VQYKLTPKRSLLAVGVWLILMLALVGRAMCHQWNLTVSVLGGIVATILAVGLAFGVGSPSVQADGIASESAAAEAPARQFRNSIVMWVTLVLGLLVLMKSLDALQVPWRDWLK
jgi:hypothetical protein